MAAVDWIHVSSHLRAVLSQTSVEISSGCSAVRCSLQIQHKRRPVAAFMQKRKLWYTWLDVLPDDNSGRLIRISYVEHQILSQIASPAVLADHYQHENLLQCCAIRQLFLSSTDFVHSILNHATWHPPSVYRPWTKINHVAANYGWSSCIHLDQMLVCWRLRVRWTIELID